MGEGVYIDGLFVGYRKYFVGENGYRIEEMMPGGKILADRKYDRQGRLVTDKIDTFNRANDVLKQDTNLSADVEPQEYLR